MCPTGSTAWKRCSSSGSTSRRRTPPSRCTCWWRGTRNSTGSSRTSSTSGGAALLHRLVEGPSPVRPDHGLQRRRRVRDLRDDERPWPQAHPDRHAQGLPARQHGGRQAAHEGQRPLAQAAPRASTSKRKTPARTSSRPGSAASTPRRSASARRAHAQRTGTGSAPSSIAGSAARSDRVGLKSRDDFYQFVVARPRLLQPPVRARPDAVDGSLPAGQPAAFHPLQRRPRASPSRTSSCWHL